MKKIYIILLFSFILLAEEAKITSGIHQQNIDSFQYSIYTPEGYNLNKKSPMILLLHGAGDTGENFINVWTKLLPKNEEYIIVAPTYHGYWWTNEGEKFVLKVIENVISIYNIDIDRIFLSGFSNGAIGAYHLGTKYPNLFAGIIPISGLPLNRELLKNLSNLPILILHGTKDSLMSVNDARKIVEMLKGMKYDVTYHEHELGHRPPKDFKQIILNWCKDKKRVQYPKKIVYVVTHENSKAYWIKINKVNNREENKLSTPGFLGVATEEIEGKLIVRNVTKDSAAEKAGILPGDIIISVEGIKISTRTELTNIIKKYKAGDKICISLQRNNEIKEIIAELGKRPQEFESNPIGEIKAEISSHNKIFITSDKIKQFTIYFSDELIDFTKPVEIKVNGKQVFNDKIKKEKPYLEIDIE
jgi:predicted esterase